MHVIWACSSIRYTRVCNCLYVWFMCQPEYLKYQFYKKPSYVTKGRLKLCSDSVLIIKCGGKFYKSPLNNSGTKSKKYILKIKIISKIYSPLYRCVHQFSPYLQLSLTNCTTNNVSHSFTSFSLFTKTYSLHDHCTIKSFQVNFVVDTVVSHYCICYEIYLNSLYV